ncbi:hypothetical protein So717_22310 [Roseobacter cerasinus]|uniref:Uncharacterized protein n=1 Tax=Roseobacter cerasinus TaxID=2602289 RepID=A0A640VPX2_9RHOB|nr:hypothetical protein So717_22310 [Roseobacter cerasinus]
MAALTLLLGAEAAVAACGTDEAACEVDLGVYHAQVPEGDIKGAILYLHGFGGSGEGALGPRDWVNTALARGYVLIAPDGLPIAEGRGRGWSFVPGRPERRDEHAFLRSVRDDAAARFGFDADEMILSGFSIGGSMTSYMACEAPKSFAAYAPVAGGFWRPHPTACSGPVRLLHTHGWTDGTVPLEGRVLRGGDATNPEALMQGDIFYTLRMWREVNACNQLRADRFVTQGPFMRRAWDRCAEGSALEFALFPGGHVVPSGWADMMLDWYESL